MRLGLKILPVLFVVMLGYVVQRTYVMKLGYEIEGLKKEQKNLEQIHKSLLIERATLISTERIERLATSFIGMKNPDNSQIVIVKDYDKTGNTNTYAGLNVEVAQVNSQAKLVKQINQ
ncbi:MAG: cell division protein FtsL [Nitrospirae bacterium]|nr:cell division protein FtsL [Nitrospirota bacterium]